MALGDDGAKHGDVARDVNGDGCEAAVRHAVEERSIPDKTQPNNPNKKKPNNPNKTRPNIALTRVTRRFGHVFAAKVPARMSQNANAGWKDAHMLMMRKPTPEPK